MNKIGQLLKQERIKRKITLKELASLTNISISTLSNIENNKIKRISNVFLYRICEILKIDYNYIANERWEIKPPFFNGRKHTIARK